MASTTTMTRCTSPPPYPLPLLNSSPPHPPLLHDDHDKVAQEKLEAKRAEDKNEQQKE
jgi:hypothetical protein